MSKRDYKNHFNRLIPLRSRLLWAFFDAKHKISQIAAPSPYWLKWILKDVRLLLLLPESTQVPETLRSFVVRAATWWGPQTRRHLRDWPDQTEGGEGDAVIILPQQPLQGDGLRRGRHGRRRRRRL